MRFRASFRNPWGVALLAALAAGTVSRAADSPATAPVADAPAIVATDARFVSRPELTRISFVLSGAADVRAYVLAEPDRVVVDLPQINFMIDPAIGRPRLAAGKSVRGKTPAPQPLGGVVGSYRFGLFAPGKSRIVIDLAEPARVVRAVAERGADGVTRLIVDLARVDRAAFLALSRQKPAGSEPVVAAPAVVAPGDKPVIVLDAGHGGIDDGAHAPDGTLEKTIVLDFVRALATRLEAGGRYKVVMTRATDVFIPLADRVKIAQDAGASLFVSIHADTLSDEPSVSGATIYTVADKASDAMAAKVAEQENQSDAVAGVESGDDKNGVADILFDLTRRETRAYSHVFAGTLVDYFKQVARLNKNSRRSAGFRVLKAPDVPSVLLELGYLSSARDEPNLVSTEWRDRVAGAVADAVDRFFSARAPLGTKAAVNDDDSRLDLKASFDAAGRQDPPR